MKEKITADYRGFSLVNGGLIYLVISLFPGARGSKKSLIRTAVSMVLVTWFPLMILSVVAGTLNDNDQVISFPEDFLVHLRFLLVIPFLILIEDLVDRSFTGYVKNADSLVPDEQQSDFNRMVAKINALTDSLLPEILYLLILIAVVIVNWSDLPLFDSLRNYFSTSSRELTLAGWYYLLVCSPLFQLLVFRWLWRWVVWVYSIIRISRLKLQIDPLHADRMAGLEFLNIFPLTYSFLLMAPSAILSAIIGIDIIYQGATLASYLFHIVVYVVFLPILLYMPLLVFIPKLIEARTFGVTRFGNLIRKHNSDYVNKWILKKGKFTEELLGTMDNSSLADINGSYGPVQGTKLIPLNLQMLALSFLLNVIPYLPLVFTYYSASELFKDLIQNVIGG